MSEHHTVIGTLDSQMVQVVVADHALERLVVEAEVILQAGERLVDERPLFGPVFAGGHSAGSFPIPEARQ